MHTIALAEVSAPAMSASEPSAASWSSSSRPSASSSSSVPCTHSVAEDCGEGEGATDEVVPQVERGRGAAEPVLDALARELAQPDERGDQSGEERAAEPEPREMSNDVVRAAGRRDEMR